MDSLPPIYLVVRNGEFLRTVQGAVMFRTEQEARAMIEQLPPMAQNGAWIAEYVPKGRRMV